MGGEQRVTAVIANELAKEYEVTIFTKDTKEEIAKNPYQVSNAIKIVTYQDPHLNKVSRILRRILRDINERTGLWYQKKVPLSCCGMRISRKNGARNGYRCCRESRLTG